MLQIVAINDTLPNGKLLIGLLKEFESRPVREKAVTFLTEEEIEQMEDDALGKMIEEGRTGKHINTAVFLKKIKSK